MIIYKITNSVNDKVYIGQTTKDLQSRIKNHRNAMLGKKDTHLYRAMRKYGWDKFTFEVIDTAESQEELNMLEEYYIKLYDSVANGYNMAYGGAVNVMYSPVVAIKHNDKMRDPSVRKKISDSMKQSYKTRGGASEDHRKHLSENKKAFYQTERGRAVAEQFSKRFYISPEHRERLNKALRKSVYCVDASNTIIAEFESVKDAAQWWYEHGRKAAHVKNLCNDIKRSYDNDKYIDGLKWIYRV